MTTEEITRLLLVCSRLDPFPSEEREALRLLETGPDWDKIVLRAADEGTGPLVHWNLRRLSPSPSGPGPEGLRALYLQNVGRTARLFALLQPFLEAVRESGSRVAFTKGARLALTLYPDPALRPFGDIDCIVHPQDWPAVAAALETTGFGRAPVSGIRPEAASPGPAWAFSPYYRKSELLLEVHFNPLGLHFPLRSEADFWASTARIPVLETEALILSAEFELAAVCLHAEQHSFSKLMWLADIAGLAAKAGVDWKGLASICEREKIWSSVSYALHLVEGVWPGALPREALARFPARPGAWRIHRALWPLGEVKSRERALPWPYYMPTVLSLWERKNPLLALRTLPRILFPPRAWMTAVEGGSGGRGGGGAAYLRRIFRPMELAARKILSR